MINAVPSGVAPPASPGGRPVGGPRWRRGERRGGLRGGLRGVWREAEGRHSFRGIVCPKSCHRVFELLMLVFAQDGPGSAHHLDSVQHSGQTRAVRLA